MHIFKNMSDKKIKIIKYLIILTIVFCVLITGIYIWHPLSFGWYSNNHYVEASGLSAGTKGSPKIIISKTENGPDISDDDFLTVVPAIGTKIRPGAYGSFSAFVSTNPALDSFSFHINCCTKSININDSITEIAEITDPYYSDYVKTHIAFFLKYEDGTYSDWINPNDGITVNSETPVCSLTVYWVWIETYKNLCSPEYDVGEHYKDNMSMWFSGLLDYNWNSTPDYYSDYYNNADFALGEGLCGTKICFSTEFSLS